MKNMKINILLPYKEKFDENKASSVSITVRNNLLYSNYLNEIKIFGQNVESPLEGNKAPRVDAQQAAQAGSYQQA